MYNKTYYIGEHSTEYIFNTSVLYVWRQGIKTSILKTIFITVLFFIDLFTCEFSLYFNVGVLTFQSNWITFLQAILTHGSCFLQK